MLRLAALLSALVSVPASASACDMSMGRNVGRIVFSGSVGKKTADNTQPQEKLYPPLSFSEAHLKHIWSINEASLEHMSSTSGSHSMHF
jgi:hypothetical protein